MYEVTEFGSLVVHFSCEDNPGRRFCAPEVEIQWPLNHVDTVTLCSACKSKAFSVALKEGDSWQAKRTGT